MEEVCRERLRRYPNDSLAYEHLIGHQTETDSAIKLTMEAIKKNVPISDGTIATIGSLCYAENKYKEAVYFLEKMKDFTAKFYLYYFNYYVKALIKIGKPGQAKKCFLNVLTARISKDTLSHLDYFYIIENAIVQKIDDIVEQYYSIAQTKLKPYSLLNLRTSMAKWFCEKKEKEKALKLLHEALKDTIAPQIYQVMGDCYKNFANYDSAEICYTKALESTKNNWSKLETILGLSDIYLKTDNKDKVAAILNDFLKDIKYPADYVDEIKKWCNEKNANDILGQLSLPSETVEEQVPEVKVEESDPKVK